MNNKTQTKKSRFAETYSGNKIPKLTKAIYPWSGIFRDACYALIGTFLLQYAMTSGVLSSDVEVYKQQVSIITIVMMIALVWDGINDPIMGFIVEKFRFKSGKFKPWILIGAIGNSILVSLIFIIGPLGVTGWAYVACMLVFYFLWDLLFTMNDIGYWSMLPSLTNDPTEKAAITTNTTIATTIGAFIMNLAMFLLPTMLGAKTAYAWTGILISVLFLISQAAIYFFCKEREKDPEQEEVSSETHFLDMFKMVIKNKQLLCIVIVVFLYYFASGLLTGIGLNYYYLLYGYGTYKGGLMATILSIVFVLGTLIAQAFYPLLAKKLKKMQICDICFAITIISYIAFFLFAFPVFGENPLSYNDPNKYNITGPEASLFDGLKFVFGGSHWISYIFAFIFFAASGILYLNLLVMFQDTIDYQEWKFGERKEAVAFSWRPLDVKLSSALQMGIRNLTFIASGTITILNKISDAERNNIIVNGKTEYHGPYPSFEDEIAAAYQWTDKQQQLLIFGIIIIGIIVVAFAIGWAYLHFGYKIDDKTEEEMSIALEARRAADKATKENKQNA